MGSRLESFLIDLAGVGIATVLGMLIYPVLSRLWLRSTGRLERYQQVKVEQATKALDDIFMEVKPKWVKVAYWVGPVVAGLLILAVFKNVLLMLVGVAVGALAPDLWLRQVRTARRHKFQLQLVDGLFILSSSLRAGLSLPQAFEQLESEMPPPASQEFGLMMKAHRLGRTLEDSLQGLNDRMPCDELNLITTAVLVARETGGDITGIINQMVTTIRERQKLTDKVRTLTIQGRLQAYIMSLLPILFAVFIRTVNPRYFETMLTDPTGQLLLKVAVGLWFVGMVLLFRLCRVTI